MALVLKTYGEQLAEIQEAISAVNASQRYEINGRMMQKADLRYLHQREKWLTTQLNNYGDIVAGSTKTRGACKVSFE